MPPEMNNNENTRLDLEGIKRMIPHREPFLMIDSVEDIQAGKSAVGMKAIDASEPHFEGHFPGHPIMPGVLIVEAIAQTAAVLVVHSLSMDGGPPLVYLMTADKCKFRRLVKPGDMLELHVEILRSRRRIWRVSGRAMVSGEVVAEAVIDAMMVPNEENS